MSTHSKQKKQAHHQERISVHRVMKDINYMFNQLHSAPNVRGNELKDAERELKR